RLRLNDVLVSSSASIGKVGIVRDGAVGAVPAAGIQIVRPDVTRLDPAFLAAYLQSPTCQQWLQAQAHGSVILHIRQDVLPTLPVPLPLLPLQKLAAAQHSEFGTDVLTFLP